MSDNSTRRGKRVKPRRGFLLRYRLGRTIGAVRLGGNDSASAGLTTSREATMRFMDRPWRGEVRGRDGFIARLARVLGRGDNRRDA
jgi:hypothetical protein